MHQVHPTALRDPSSVLACLRHDLKLEHSIHFAHIFEERRGCRGREAGCEGLGLVSIAQVLLVEGGAEGDFAGGSDFGVAHWVWVIQIKLYRHSRESRDNEWILNCLAERMIESMMLFV